MGRVCSAAVLAGAILAVPRAGGAQVYYQPQARPIVTAENDTWFLNGEPITVEGHYYYPAGPRVFFNGSVMVRTGSYRGVPIYADTTQEPYSVVLIPLPGGLMQPYERRRTREMAGTTGSRAPSFPGDIAGERSVDASAPTTMATPGPPVWSEPDELLIEKRMTDAAAATQRRRAPAGSAGPMRGEEAAAPVASLGGAASRDVLEAGLKPKGLNEIYVLFAGYRWRSAGPGETMRAEDFEIIGDYHGRPVYRARKDDNDSGRIFLEGLQGFVAPYERAGSPVKY